MSYERTQKALLDLFGVEISQGGIDEIMKRAGKRAFQKVAGFHNSSRRKPPRFSGWRKPRSLQWRYSRGEEFPAPLFFKNRGGLSHGPAILHISPR